MIGLLVLNKKKGKGKKEQQKEENQALNAEVHLETKLLIKLFSFKLLMNDQNRSFY